MNTYFRASDHKEWDAAGLDKLLQSLEMEYCNQAPDYGDSYSGDWFACDDKTRTVFHGTFGNDHSPGASQYTYAMRHDDEEGYRKQVAAWEKAPEYLEFTHDDEECV